MCHKSISRCSNQIGEVQTNLEMAFKWDKSKAKGSKERSQLKGPIGNAVTKEWRAEPMFQRHFTMVLGLLSLDLAVRAPYVDFHIWRGQRGKPLHLAVF